jgi:hypothetical protein
LKGGSAKTVLRVDGGMVASDWTMQRLADILDAPVDRPTVLETTALGAAWLAGSKAGVWPKAKDFAKKWALNRRFEPAMGDKERRAKIKGWRGRGTADAVIRLTGLISQSRLLQFDMVCARRPCRRSESISETQYPCQICRSAVRRLGHAEEDDA